jgi:hypothetical protein
MVGAEAEFHLPAGTRWQIDASSRALASNRDFPHNLDLTSSASASCFVADRWAVAGSVSQARLYTLGGSSYSRPDDWRVSYGLSAGFFVEDRLLLGATALETQESERYDRHYYSRDARFSLGLTYRFIGALQAPGLIEPMRLLPVTKAPY